MNSKFFALGLKDIVKGLIVAFLTALITGLYQLIQVGPFELNWVTFQPIVLSSVGAALAYLIKNLFTNSEGLPLTTETK